jgi:hypothetical protein
MNPDPYHSDPVQKLLALKRHEQPPPRYFHEFSSRVTSRLSAREMPVPPTWWQRVGFDFKPALVCALGVIVCGMLLAGVIASLNLDRSSQLAAKPADHTPLVFALSGNLELASDANNVNPVVRPEMIPASTAPVTGVPGGFSPFSRFTLSAERVAFSVGGGRN